LNLFGWVGFYKFLIDPIVFPVGIPQTCQSYSEHDRVYQPERLLAKGVEEKPHGDPEEGVDHGTDQLHVTGPAVMAPDGTATSTKRS